MIMNASDFLEPKQQYNFLKDTHKQNCEALLEKLIQEAKVDEAANVTLKRLILQRQKKQN